MAAWARANGAAVEERLTGVHVVQVDGVDDDVYCNYFQGPRVKQALAKFCNSLQPDFIAKVRTRNRVCETERLHSRSHVHASVCPRGSVL